MTSRVKNSMNTAVIKSIAVIALAICLHGCAEQDAPKLTPVKLEEDRRNHGPLDGHAVMVLELLEDMNLDRDVMTRYGQVARKSQNDYRKWYRDNKSRVDEFNNRIKKLKAENNKAELKKILPEKKKFMHTAPSLLRYPEPLENILNEKDHAVFMARLNALRVSLHKPRKK